MAALPFCHAETSVKKPKSTVYPAEVRTIGDQIRRRRMDLRLLQRDVAQRIGVSIDTICNWEGNRFPPAKRYLPFIEQFLAEVVN